MATAASWCPLLHVIAYKRFPLLLSYWTCISRKREKSRMGIRISNPAHGETEAQGIEAVFPLPNLVPKSARLHSFGPLCAWFPLGISSTKKNPLTLILPEASRTKTPHCSQAPRTSAIPSHPLSSAQVLRPLASPSTPGWHSKPTGGPWHASHLFKSENVYPRDCGLIDWLITENLIERSQLVCTMS